MTGYLRMTECLLAATVGCWRLLIAEAPYNDKKQLEPLTAAAENVPVICGYSRLPMENKML